MTQPEHKSIEGLRKCTCVPHGMCLRCAEMEINAHSKGYDHAMKDLIKRLTGKKPTDRFGDWKDKLEPHLNSRNLLERFMKKIRMYQMGWVKSDGNDGFEYAPEYQVIDNLIRFLDEFIESEGLK